MIISPSAISPYKIPTFQSGGQPPFSFGNALKFDGVNDYVSFSNITTTTTWSISFWFKYISGMLFSNFGASNEYIQSFNSTNLRIVTGADSKFYAVPAMTIGTWYHCFISVNSGSARLYLNSVQSLSGAQTNNTSITLNAMGTFNGGSFYFGGTLDEVGILTGVAGTAQNAIDLYNSGNGANFETIMGGSTAYWRMNGTSGDSTAIDEQGTYNGTLNNFNTATCWVAH
jgi:hypothetical protein